MHAQLRRRRASTAAASGWPGSCAGPAWSGAARGGGARPPSPIPNAEARAVDLIKRASGPAPQLDTRWCGDITYIWTWEGWAYLATVIDLASRRVVGWAMADHMRTDLVADALRMACIQRRPPAGVIFHSDRGCQYTSHDYAALPPSTASRLSLGRKGQCWDNAVAESWFATFKNELIDTRAWPTLAGGQVPTEAGDVRLSEGRGYDRHHAPTDQVLRAPA